MNKRMNPVPEPLFDILLFDCFMRYDLPYTTYIWYI